MAGLCAIAPSWKSPRTPSGKSTASLTSKSYWPRTPRRTLSMKSRLSRRTRKRIPTITKSCLKTSSGPRCRHETHCPISRLLCARFRKPSTSNRLMTKSPKTRKTCLKTKTNRKSASRKQKTRMIPRKTLKMNPRRNLKTTSKDVFMC